MANRLARERSPYLLQHAENPVDWYPWGEEAFARARALDRPIFLSIGYSTCHWCHVMAHESFEHEAVAALLNRDFVPIKVDREERPDVDRVYMTFVQATTGAGGWPLSVWLTPALEPFFGGTYFPPEGRWGRPGFLDILAQLASAWRTDRPGVGASAHDMLTRLREATTAGRAGLDRAPVAGRPAVEAGIAAFAQAYDARHGGFGGAPKFPRPSELLFLLHAWALTGDDAARTMAVTALRAMAMGGIRDHVGGGFHRYSVDAEWRVPHFEKMLYDQAQLVLAYLEAAQASGDPFYGAVAEDTLAYVARELTAPDGAFYSAEDADSLAPVEDARALEGPGPRAEGPEKREGAFYVWSAAEVDALFGADALIVRRRFGIEDGGNALADPQGEFRGRSILYVAQSIEDVAARADRPVEDVMRVLAAARRTLFDARARRPRPHRDDKVIAAWNGLTIAACARAARVLVDSPQRGRWLEAAERAAAAVRAHLWQPERQRLLRRYRDGDAAIEGFCEDYAFLIWGLVELVQAGGDPAWLEWALTLARQAEALFSDEQDGGWFASSGGDPSVLLRLKEDYDGAEPSGASVMARNLIVLAHLVGDPAARARAARTLERYGPELGRVARVMPLMLANVALWHLPPVQIAIAGAAEAADTHALERVAAARYIPGAVIVPVVPGERQRAWAVRLPWTAGMGPRDGRAAAYVCRDAACDAPVTDPAALEQSLDAFRPSRIIT